VKTRSSVPLRMLIALAVLGTGCPSSDSDGDTDPMATTGAGSTSTSTSAPGTTETTDPDPDTSGGSTSTSSGDTTGGETTGDETGDETTGDATGEDTTGGDESSTGNAPDPFCGDGNVDADEECDDANDNDNDSCTSQCQQQWFSGNDGECSADLADYCDYHGAQCRLNLAGDDGYCVWTDATDEAGCDQTPGIWTLADSGFATDHPEVVFPDDAACITQVANLRCGDASDFACTVAEAALCTLALSANGLEETGPEICYWTSNQAQCDLVPGMWTEPGDGFAMDHPNALPAGMAACITQVTNL